MNMTPVDCQSLAELMRKAYNISLDLSYSELCPLGHYLSPRESGLAENEDMVFGWSDGLMHKYAQTRMSGRCSVDAMLSFDIAQFEAEILTDIATMEALLVQIGAPVRLTFAEMRRRGYRGEWAGEGADWLERDQACGPCLAGLPLFDRPA